MQVDTHGFLDIERLARHSHFAHAAVRAIAHDDGLVVVAALVVLACLRARTRAYGSPRRLAGALWAGLAGFVALGLAPAIAHFVGRTPPYRALPHVVLLVPALHGSSLPCAGAAVAGAAATGLWWCRDRLFAVVASLAALAIAFSLVYVGAYYPGDALAGLGLGLVVASLGYPLAVPVLERALLGVARTPLRVVVAAARRPRPEGAGPAAHGIALEATGAVRLLDDREPSPRPAAPDPSSGRAGVAGS